MAKAQKHFENENYNGTSYGEASAADARVALEMAARAGQPICFVGLGGTGKTSMLNAWSLEHGYGDTIAIIGSQMEPQDVAGLPHAAYDEYLGVNYTEYLAPVWQKILSDGKPHVLFFDEFSNTPRSVQAALLKIIGERRFANGQKIPDETVIVMAMNPESQAVDYTPIAAPMANRILFLSYRPTDKEVYEGLSGGWFTEEEREAWKETYEGEWREAIVEFLKKEPQLILAENDLTNTSYDSSKEAYLNPDSEKSESEREILVTTWASPRSWDNSCRLLATSKPSGELTPFQERLLNGMVGRKATARFTEFMHKRQRVDGFALILDPSKQNWKAASRKGAHANDIQEAVTAVITKIPLCDGLEGRPGPKDVMDFFDKVIDLGGAPFFATYFAQAGETREWINNARPSDVTPKEWTERICELLVKFKTADVL